MKKWIYAAGAALALTVSANTLAAEPLVIVNMSEVFQQMPDREAIGKKLESEFKGRAAELQKMEQSLKTKLETLQRDASMMKASDRKKAEENIMAERQKFAEKAQAFEQDNRRRQMEERDKLLQKIQKTVSQIAKKKGYNVVIDASSVVYADDAKDISADVLKQVK